ncbi:MAG TPA: isoprenylcysteine carboxylmethyltransferase family protein [Steroidobacteraceae bacterium]
MLVRIGNFFFRYRDFVFPFALLFVFLPGPAIFADPLLAVGLGFLVSAAGQLVRGTTIGFKYIIRGGRDRRVYAADLVTEGLYGHSRNPMYVGNVLILTGIALASDTWTCFLLAVPFCVFIYVSIIAAEENFLRGKFGPAFDAYCRDVPRWLPRLKGLGETLRSMEFRWQRVIVKEYGTPFGWITMICVVGAVHLWRAGQLVADDPAARALLAVWLVTFLLWAVARVLKKTKVLATH